MLDLRCDNFIRHIYLLRNIWFRHGKGKCLCCANRMRFRDFVIKCRAGHIQYFYRGGCRYCLDFFEDNNINR